MQIVHYLITVTLILSLLMVLLLLYFKNKKQGQVKTFKKQNETPEFNVISEYETPHHSAEQYKDPDVLVQDVSSLEMPSPVRELNKIDAVVMDFLKNSAEIPSSVLEISASINKPEMHMQKVAELIATDPLLSSKILRIANSAAVARGKVTSINTAIMLLGLNQVSLLVGQMLTTNTIKSAFEIEAEDMLSLWRHSASVSCCTRHVMLSLKSPEPSLVTSVQTCALLHDIGKFYLRGLKSVGKVYLRGLRTSDEFTKDYEKSDTGRPPCIFSEIEEYGTDHCHIGYILADFWALPEIIATTIGYHHHMSFANYQDIPEEVRKTVAIVAIGNYMANVVGYNETGVTCKVPDVALKEVGMVKPLDSFFTNQLIKEIRYTDTLITEAEKS